MVRAWKQVQWFAVGIAFVGAACAAGPHRPWGYAVAASAGLATYALHRRALRYVRRDLERLEAAVDNLVEGPTETVVLPVVWRELLPLGEAVEKAYGQSRLQTRLLEQQRENLALHLTRTEERLRDPTAEARRSRIARMGDLRAELTVGDQQEPAALLDLSLDSAVLGVKPEHGERLVPGLPVQLRITVQGASLDVSDALALAPARGGLLDLKEWVFRFDPPLQPGVLPAGLAKALELRGAERIRPLAQNPVSTTLVCDLGRVPADVVDVSASGLGVATTIEARRAGRIGTSFTIQIHLPAMGEVAILPVTLRNMAVRTDGVRMGLSFDREADPTELSKVEAWLEATRKVLAA